MRIEENNPKDYTASVNRAIDHILKSLAQPLQLDRIAEVAGFSPFHFHRIFRSLVGETLNQFVGRLRLERALKMLSHDQRPTLTEVAFACGFASSSDFSRSFKKRYGVPPSTFDIDVFRKSRRAELQEAIADPQTRHLLDRLAPELNPDNFAVQLKSLPARRVAYLRVFDPYRPEVVANAAGRLLEWAEERGLADGQWLGYMWDDPEIVARDKCRYDVGLEISEGQADDSVSLFQFPAMQVAQLEVRGGIDLEMRAIDWLFGTWLPRSGYVPTAHPSFEAWIGRPFEHGYEHFELHVQLPVVRC